MIKIADVCGINGEVSATFKNIYELYEREINFDKPHNIYLYDDIVLSEQVKEELEDRFGKLDDKILIYMYEEWFDYLAKSLGIQSVKQLENLIEIEIPEDVSNKVHGDKLFLEIKV